MRTISYKVSYENMISRLPALFAFLEIDEQGTCNIVEATKGEQGDYGKLVANIIVPEGCGFEYTCSNNVSLKIKEKKEYTYRTIIETYYKAINDREWSRNNNIYEENFLAFVERGIGKKYVGLTQEKGKKSCGVPLTNTFPLAPDYIYLGDAQAILDKMVRMKKQLDFYEKHTKNCKEDKKRYEYLKTEYELTNGDKLIEKLYELVKEAKEVANEYLEYSKGTTFTLDFNVNLVNTIKDLGMVTPYIQEWEGGKRYYEGDVVYYVDENGYGMTWECVFKDGDADVKTDKNKRKYTEGHYDTNTEIITFDINNWKPQSLNWVNRNIRYVCPKCGRFYEKDMPSNCTCGYQFIEGKDKPYKYQETMPNTITVSGTCNSHLTSLRRYESYMSQEEQAETPDAYQDWLWYYRIGRIMNREAKYDELGNLGVMYDEKYDDSVLYGKGVEAIVNDGNTIGINLKSDISVVAEFSTYVVDNEFDIYMAKKNITVYEVKETFTETETTPVEQITVTYTKGEIISKEKYSFITDENKNKITIFEYVVGDILSDERFNSLLDNDKNKVESVKYAVKTDITKSFYNGLDHKRQQNCSEAKHFIGESLSDELYSILDAEEKNCCKKYFINLAVWGDVITNITAVNDKESGQGTLTFGYLIGGHLKATEGKTIKVKESIVLNGTSYKKGDIITYKTYKEGDKQREAEREKNPELEELKITFKVNTPFTYGGKKYEENAVIDYMTYENLDDSIYEVIEEFNIGEKKYKVETKLTKKDYDELTDLHKECCECTSYKVIEEFNVGKKEYKEGDILTVEEYDALSNENKEKCVGNEYKVKKEFSVVSQKHNVGDTLSKNEYNLLSDTNKTYCECVSYKVIKEFKNGGITYEVGTIILKDTYYMLSDTNKALCEEYEYKVIEEFGVASKKYNIGDTLTKAIYEQLTDDYKECCKCNKDNISITVKIDNFVKEIKQYVSGSEIPQEEYNEFSVSNQNKCIIKVDKDFLIKIDEEKWNAKLNYHYFKGDIIPHASYISLSKENKGCVKIFATDVINIKTYYIKGEWIERKKYDALTKQQKINNVIFTVLKTFVDGSKGYSKDDEIGKNMFNELVAENEEVINYGDIIVGSEFVISDEGKTAREFLVGEYIDLNTYNSLPIEYQTKCEFSYEWYTIDDDGNYKYYFSNFDVDTGSDYGKNMGVKYTESYIYYKGDMSMEAIETFETNEKKTIYEGTILSEDEYNSLSDENKKKCKHVEESIWSLVEDGIFDRYVKGEYDKDYIPVGIDDDTNYYKLYDKMEFSYDVNSYIFRFGGKIKRVPYIMTNFSTNVDITHVDIEERPLIRYDYYNGVNFQPTTNTDDVYIERGVTQAFEKHIKLGEIKTFEDFENYANGGFFVISQENVDLG